MSEIRSAGGRVVVRRPGDASLPSGPRLRFETRITLAQLPVVRQQVEVLARRCGLTGERLSDWVTAVNELVTNALRHGGGAGQLRVWKDGRLICEVRDEGPGFSAADYASLRNRPPPSAIGGMGLWIVQQMTDDLEIDSGPAGTIVRISINVHHTQ